MKNNKNNNVIINEKKSLIINKKKIFKLNNLKIIFQKKYIARHVTFYLLLFFLILYLFIGAITTEWHNNIKIFNYIFIIINIIILCFINYEILKLINGNKWPIYIQIITYLLSVFLFLLPTKIIKNEYRDITNIDYSLYTLLNWNWLKPWIIFLIYLCIILCYYSLIFISKDIFFKKITLILFFTLYFVFALKAMNKFMLNPSYGWSSVVWLILIIITTDTIAFIFGLTYGKHKLAPIISPNKTWEGAIMGTVFSIIISVTYAILIFNFSDSKHWVFNFFSNDNNKNIMRYIIYILLSFILSVLSQLGDLLFSWIKRCFNIINFSNLLPGHGGVLDRLDSFSLVFFIMFIISNIVLEQ